MRKHTARPSQCCICADIALGVHEQDGDDKVRKVLDLLDHDVCTVIAAIM